MGLLLLFLGTAAAVSAADQRQKDHKPVHREDRILVKPKQGTAESVLGPLRARHGGKMLRKYARFGGLEVIEVEKGRDLGATISALKESGLFEYVEPDYLYQTFATPNDPMFTNQWSLHNTGQSGGTSDADIDAPEGWDIESTATNVIVAIVDTGIRLDHEDLAANLWVNAGEIAGDGIDNDGNGYIDDVHGINAVSNNGNPADNVGHGTHVAGIVGAHGNNGLGVSGVAWRVKLMALKSLGPLGGASSDAIECLNYAIAKGAHIVNASWGGFVYSQALYDTLNALRTNGIIFVAASGNSAIDLDASFLFPAAYHLDNVISVNAVTRWNTVAFFSDFGYLGTDLGAPGYEVLSTYHTNSGAYFTASGTSMAAPHVAGALALLRSRLPSEHYLGLIYRLFGNVEVTPALRGRCLSDGQLNLHKLLYEAASSSPLNDNFTNRILVSGERWTRFGRNTLANKESGEPNHAGNSGGASIWWTWTAPYSGPVELTTARSIQTNGAPLNTLLAVYTGSSVGSLTAIASNDDGNLLGDGTNTSRVTFVASAGTAYQIAVDGYGGVDGHIRLALAYVPENDALASAYKLNGLYIACDGWNLGATKETNEAAHAGNAGGRSVWWSWRAPVSGDFVLTTEGSSFDTLLAIYTGSTHPLTLVTNNNNDVNPNVMDDYGAKTSALAFPTAEGETYWIAVDGFDGQSGHVILAGGYKATVTPSAPTLTFQDGTRDEINASNQIVGIWHIQGGSPPTHGFRYDLNTSTIHDWGTWHMTNNTSGWGLNDFGTCVGYSSQPSFINEMIRHALIWDPSNGLRRLDQSNEMSQAHCIDNRGIAGGLYVRLSRNRPTVPCYWFNNQIFDLPNPITDSFAAGVFGCNRAGDMIGNASRSAPSLSSYALLWRGIPDAGFVIQLPPRLRQESNAEAINDRGEIIGECSGRAVAWIDKRPRLTGHLGFASEGRGLNNLGQFVGVTKKFKWNLARFVPFISQNGVDLNLDRLGPSTWTLNVACSINDNGVIAAAGQNTTNAALSCVISPPTVLAFRNPVLLTNDHFTVTLVGPGTNCDVEASTDLTSTNWVSLGTVTLTAGSGQFTDTNAGSYSNRFYRAKSGAKLSGNVAGYLIREIPAGYSLIANPFHCADNRIPALIPDPPDGTTMHKYDANVQNYRDPNQYVSGLGWIPDTEMTLNPGEGVIIEAFYGGFTNRWAGIVPQNLPRTSVLKASQIVGSQTAVGGQVDTDLGLPFAHGDVVHIMTGADGTYTGHTNLFGTWAPSAPKVKIGEGFWSQRADPVVWRQNLSVW